MVLETSAAPDDVLDALDALGAVDGEEDILGESESGSEEFAEPETDDGEETTQESEESDEQPAEEASEEEVEETEEESQEPEPVQPDNRAARIQALAREAKRSQRFRPILEMLEEDPNLAREIVGRKLGLVPADREPARREPAPVQPQVQWTAEQVDAYWNKRFQESPAKAFAEIMDLKLKGVREAQAVAAEPANIASFKSVVRSFKSDLQSGPNSDDQFSYYEPYFDALLKSADRNYVMSDPDTTLSALKDLAYGRWASDQRARAKKAGARGQAVTRENPRRGSLANPSGQAPRRSLKQTRPLNDDEKILAERYGLDLVTPDENEPESAWR